MTYLVPQQVAQQFHPAVVELVPKVTFSDSMVMAIPKIRMMGPNLQKTIVVVVPKAIFLDSVV